MTAATFSSTREMSRLRASRRMELEVARRARQEGAVGIGPAPAEQVVGVEAGREVRDPHLEPLLEQEIERPHRGRRARGISVVRDDRLLRMPVQEPHLSRGERRAERRHHVIEPPLNQCRGVEITFDDDCVTLAADGLPREVETIEMVPLYVRLGLGSVHVLRLRVADRAPAEGHGPPGHVRIGNMIRSRKRS